MVFKVNVTRVPEKQSFNVGENCEFQYYIISREKFTYKSSIAFTIPFRKTNLKFTDPPRLPVVN